MHKANVAKVKVTKTKPYVSMLSNRRQNYIIAALDTSGGRYKVKYKGVRCTTCYWVKPLMCHTKKNCHLEYDIIIMYK